jgi:hypothetical protein
VKYLKALPLFLIARTEEDKEKSLIISDFIVEIRNMDLLNTQQKRYSLHRADIRWVCLRERERERMGLKARQNLRVFATR